VPMKKDRRPILFSLGAIPCCGSVGPVNVCGCGWCLFEAAHAWNRKHLFDFFSAGGTVCQGGL
jgi:hypothetical protein